MAGKTGAGIIDLHADLPADVIKRRDLGERAVLETRHLPKLRKGGVTALVAPIWVESEFKPRGAVKRGLRIVDAFLEDLSESKSFALATSASGLVAAESRGTVAVVLGCEGGEFIGGDLGVLRDYQRLGLRTFGFTWNQRNALADGMYHEKDDRGLTRLGRQVVEELDDRRMLIDLAHIGPKSFWGVIEVAKRPVMVSHGATAAHRALRNSTDEQLRAIADGGGVFGIFAVNRHDTRDLGGYVDHVMHAVRVAGVEHVALGPDFCDYLREELSTPGSPHQDMVGLEDTTKIGVVLTELSRRGLSDEEIRMIARENFLRVFRKVVG
ncbi:MAG: membrane dipeptidase [Nitrososphaerales archaeon]|jgi:membrane dipeptidase